MTVENVNDIKKFDEIKEFDVFVVGDNKFVILKSRIGTLHFINFNKVRSFLISKDENGKYNLTIRFGVDNSFKKEGLSEEEILKFLNNIGYLYND